MNKSLYIIPTAALLLTLSASSVLAAATNYGSSKCQPIYGGGESCAQTPQFEINKTVQNPKTQAYVDNLGVSDPKYAPTQVVPFKITVKNTSDTRLTDVVIKDILPNVVDFAGGIGDYDAASRTLTIKLASLDAGEQRDFYVQAKVQAKDKLPQDQNVQCVINQSSVTKGDKTGQDNSQFCIEKTLPPTPTNPVNPTNPPTKGGVPNNPETNIPTTKGGIPTNPGTTTVNPPTTKGGAPVTPGTTATATTTKGGLPVYPPTNATTTPATGPMDVALLGLIPSAISGFILRRKAK